MACLFFFCIVTVPRLHGESSSCSSATEASQEQVVLHKILRISVLLTRSLKWSQINAAVYLFRVEPINDNPENL